MAFCRSCGAEVSGRFCEKCGAAADTAAAAPVSTPAGVSAPGLTNEVASALCYVLGAITGIIFLVLEPYKSNKAVRFHAFQSIFAHLVMIAVFWIVLPLFHFLPWFMWRSFYGVVSLGSVVLWLFLIWKAYNGEKIVLPFVGEFAQKNA